MDTSPELKTDGIQRYQEMTGQLRWSMGICHILLEVALMSQHMALPRECHMKELLHIFGYLKENKKLRILFDPKQPYVDDRWFKEYDWFDFYHYARDDLPPNMPEARGNMITVSMFVDASDGSNKVDRRNQTGILIFLNWAPILWYSK